MNEHNHEGRSVLHLSPFIQILILTSEETDDFATAFPTAGTLGVGRRSLTSPISSYSSDDIAVTEVAKLSVIQIFKTLVFCYKIPVFKKRKKKFNYNKKSDFKNSCSSNTISLPSQNLCFKLNYSIKFKARSTILNRNKVLPSWSSTSVALFQNTMSLTASFPHQNISFPKINVFWQRTENNIQRFQMQ